MTKKDYTYDNGRVGSRSAISRIDKFIVSQEIDSRRGRIEAPPSIRRISDHSPLVMTIWGRTSAPPTAAPYFERSFLKEEESRAALLEVWEGTKPPPRHDTEWPGWLEAATDRVLKCSTRLAKEKKRAKGTRFRTLQQKIRLAEIQLQSDPEDETVRSILSEAQGHMADSLQE
jgi:endonuclease/exonuclease/phosphatase family metal-dependent hydrolase